MFDKFFGFDLIQRETLKKLLLAVAEGTAALTVQTFNAGDIVDNSITVADTSAVITVIIPGPDDRAELNIVFPADAVTEPGTIIRVASMINVAEVTFSGSANILNPPSSMFPNDCVGFQKISGDTWIRIV